MTSRIRALIADDRARSRDSLRALLATSPEIEVIGEASDGEAAVELTGKHQPDIVLMDVTMPKMDGLEATRQIKAQWPHVRVIVLTIYTAYRADAMAAGADAFLIKGCLSESLLETILGFARPD